MTYLANMEPFDRYACESNMGMLLLSVPNIIHGSFHKIKGKSMDSGVFSALITPH